MKKLMTALIGLLATGALAVALAGGEKDMSAAKAGPTDGGQRERALFAGGCFWCMEPPFEKLDGVISVISGYTGGHKDNPTYQEVSAGTTGHAEAVEIVYDPAKVSYEELLEIFWRNIDPTDDDGQFIDRGDQYRSAIFFVNDEQERLARASKKALAESGRFDQPILTQIKPAGPFYRAEDYHQGYYEKNPIRYKFYRSGSGRDRFLDMVWGEDRDH